MNVLVVEDHKIVGDGIKLILESESINVINVVQSGAAALEILKSEHHIDVVLTDSRMPGMDGADLCKIIRQEHPGIKILMLSMLDDELEIVNAFAAGADGYVLKTITPAELVYSIKHVCQGGTYLCSELGLKFFRLVSSGMRTSTELVGLSDRQAEVLSLLAKGLTSTEISDKLFMSKRTVEGYRQDLIERTGSKNTAELIHYAVANRLIN